MSDAEKARAYEELVEKLREWASRRQAGTDNWVRGFESAMREVEKMLPPRPPKIVSVPWWEAIEGLASNPPKYRRAQPSSFSRGSVWAVWKGPCGSRAGTLVNEQSQHPWVINNADMGTWRAEVAR